MSQSIIYKNIFIYRFVMSMIYLGAYKKRFRSICKLLKPNSGTVTELCFGDTFIAGYCRMNGINWTGYDLNAHFVNRALKLKYNAHLQDISKMNSFGNCDTCIIVGSLYHFKEEASDILIKMISSANQVIISEPVKNLSSAKGIIGFIAKRSANAGKGSETFRFNEQSFLDMIDKLDIDYKIISVDKDILIEINNDRN